MAASAGRSFFTRSAIASLKSAVRSPPPAPAGKFGAAATPSRRFSYLSRLPAELGGAQSLLPLHSAVAAARLTSCLSLTSRSCRSLSQGT